MPLFMALGDEQRLSIIEVLTQEAFGRRQPSGYISFEENALNVNEITRRTSLAAGHLPPRKNLKGRRPCGRAPGRDGQLLLSDPAESNRFSWSWATGWKKNSSTSHAK